MADDKKNIPEAAPPTEAPAPAVENAAVLEQPSPGPALTDAEAVMLEHEGQAVLFEMGEAVPCLLYTSSSALALSLSGILHAACRKS